MSSSTDEVVAAAAAVLVGCGLPASSAAVARAREQAERAHRAPADSQFTIPTQALARVMRALKQRAQGEAARASVDENFVKIVTKVSASRAGRLLSLSLSLYLAHARARAHARAMLAQRRAPH